MLIGDVVSAAPVIPVIVLEDAADPFRWRAPCWRAVCPCSK